MHHGRVIFDLNQLANLLLNLNQTFTFYFGFPIRSPNFILNIGLLNYFDKKVNYRNNGIKFVFRAKMMRVFQNKISIKLNTILTWRKRGVKNKYSEKLVYIFDSCTSM